MSVGERYLAIGGDVSGGALPRYRRDVPADGGTGFGAFGPRLAAGGFYHDIKLGGSQFYPATEKNNVSLQYR